MTKLLSAVAAVWLALCALPPPCAAEHAVDPDAYFSELKARYLRLRNTDIEITRPGEWETLAKQFETFVDQQPRYGAAAFGLYDASILYEQLYRRFGGIDRLQKSAALLERVAKEYPGHEIADDALLKRGDIFLYDLHQLEDAKRAYQEIITAYPDAAMRDVAEARLRRIAEGRLPKAAPPAQAAPSVEGGLLKKGNRPLIVIDPGHGGEDFGAVGQSGLLEKDVVLAIAVELEKVLTEKLPVVVRLTRRRDVFVPLAERTALANDYEADLFVSLHANSDPSKRATGIEVYYLDNTQDQGSMKLAERENASVRFEGRQGDLYFMLSDLIQNAKLDDSVLLANVLEQKLTGALHARWPKTHARGVKKAPFYVLVGAHMPCVIAELFFINNPVDGTNLGKPEFRSDVAGGLYQGVREFLVRQGRLS